MQSMTEVPLVIGGVDAHADVHHYATLDSVGTLLGSKAFPASTRGYADALEWLRAFGQLDAIAVESTGSYAAGLVRYLRKHDIEIREVNQPHPHSRRRVGKSDPIDAEMAARLLLAGKAKAIPKQTDGIVEAIRTLRVARNSAVKARTIAMIQIRDLIITAPAPLREQLTTRKSLRGKATICARFRIANTELHDPSQAAKFALRALARRIDALDQEITDIDEQLGPLVQTAAPRMVKLLGISTGHAGQMLVTAGENIDRLNSEAAFAAICGASPVPASSGKTVRHRLNPGGDRQANRALHLIAVCRLRYCHRTRAYAERRALEGKTQREIMRCLKRYIAREIYTTLKADLADLADLGGVRTPSRATAILCGSPGFGITRYRP
jgi:transposase